MDNHKIVVGLGFGDEGKGTIVDYLCSQDKYGAVVRFSGGPQAAHNVVTPEGVHHTFSQFGSGTFTETPTILSRFMLVNPMNLAEEAKELDPKLGFDPFDLLCISENSLVVTPYHIKANQIREIDRGEDAHGSCGQGVGETQNFALEYPEFALRMKDLQNWETTVIKLTFIKSLLEAQIGQIKSRSPENIATMYQFFLNDNPDIIRSDEWITDFISKNACVFEGSQGVLLDEWRGFHPYTTWSTTTSENALQLLSEAGKEDDVEVIGVTRTYHTRHGYGPFPSEYDSIECYPEEHNAHGEFQGAWRAGALDISLLKYAVEVDGNIDTLALTHVDVPVTGIAQTQGFDLSKNCGTLEEQEKITNGLLNNKPLFDTYETNSYKLLKASIEHPAVTGKSVKYVSQGPRRDQKLTL